MEFTEKEFTLLSVPEVVILIAGVAIREDEIIDLE